MKTSPVSLTASLENFNFHMDMYIFIRILRFPKAIAFLHEPCIAINQESHFVILRPIYVQAVGSACAMETYTNGFQKMRRKKPLWWIFEKNPALMLRKVQSLVCFLSFFFLRGWCVGNRLLTVDRICPFHLQVWCLRDWCLMSAWVMLGVCVAAVGV